MMLYKDGTFSKNDLMNQDYKLFPVYSFNKFACSTNYAKYFIKYVIVSADFFDNLQHLVHEASIL